MKNIKLIVNCIALSFLFIESLHAAIINLKNEFIETVKVDFEVKGIGCPALNPNSIHIEKREEYKLVLNDACTALAINANSVRGRRSHSCTLLLTNLPSNLGLIITEAEKRRYICKIILE